MSNHKRKIAYQLPVWIVFVAFGVSGTPGASHADPPPTDSHQPNKWEDDIAKLEALDSDTTFSGNAILFVGSSSIRRWDTIDRDMAPYSAIRRGFGGCKYNDVAHFAPRLIEPHDYRALVIFVGNDVKGSDEDHSPDQVEQWVDETIDVAQAHRNDSPIFLVEVTPSAKRFDAWPRIRQLNARLREIALRRRGVFFIATADHFLDFEKSPRRSLFDDDDLHLNAAGYDLWASLIRRHLDDVFRMMADSPDLPRSLDSSTVPDTNESRAIESVVSP